jgi:predicted secreted protein
MIESENSENARYAKRSSQFNNVYKQFTDWYNRNNMPKSTGKQFI